MLEKRGLNPGKPGSLAFGLGGQMLGPSWPIGEGEFAAFFVEKLSAQNDMCFKMDTRGIRFFVCVREVACHANQTMEVKWKGYKDCLLP